MNDLCAACGLCCNGWLFRDVRVTAAEVAQLAIEPTYPASGDARLRQPCQFHSGCACSRYEDRPAVCQTFACKSLARYLAGELTFDDAVAIVRAAVAEAASLEPLLRAAGWTLPGESGGDAWWRLMQDPRDRATDAPVMLAAIAYLLTVRQHFAD